MKRQLFFFVSQCHIADRFVRMQALKNKYSSIASSGVDGAWRKLSVIKRQDSENTVSSHVYGPL